MADDKTLPLLVAALMDPGAYPQQPVGKVELVETHISFIFFAGDVVYKIKKPVDYGFLDFTSLEKRLYFCQREVELNRRICPEVYLGVEEIRRQDGRYSVGGPGQTVEYAVKMHRLPADRSLGRLLREGEITVADVRRIAARIARFHAQAETGAQVTSDGDLEAVRKNVEENFAQCRRYVDIAISREAYEDLVAYSSAFMEMNRHLFQSRAAQGRIRDCHGDLHAAQIFLEEPAGDGSWDGISIIDCIEFNRRFRCSDVAEDVAFLAMDLDYHGRPELSLDFMEAYARESGDSGVFGLLDFFEAYRACVRGKVAALRADQPHLSDGECDGWQVAGDYFRLAHSYTPRLSAPSVILVTGVTGTGKTTLAAELGRRWGLEHISSDLVRKGLAGIDPSERRYETFGEGIYSPEFSYRTYQAMLDEGRRQLLAGRSVVLDGTYRRRTERTAAVEMARALGADCWIVQCALNDSQARERLLSRQARGDSSSDGRWDIFHRQLAQWESVAEVPPERHILLDTGGSFEENVLRLLWKLYVRILDTGWAMALPAVGNERPRHPQILPQPCFQTRPLTSLILPTLWQYIVLLNTIQWGTIDVVTRLMMNASTKEGFRQIMRHAAFRNPWIDRLLRLLMVAGVVAALGLAGSAFSEYRQLYAVAGLPDSQSVQPLSLNCPQAAWVSESSGVTLPDDSLTPRAPLVLQGLRCSTSLTPD
jgi:aminoglycoside phosphotransferase family enzyme/predicted kinase